MSVMWLLQTAEDEIIEQPHKHANTSTPADPTNRKQADDRPTLIDDWLSDQ